MKIVGPLINRNLVDKKSILRTIFKNSIWLLIDKISSYFFMFILTIIMARYLNVESYGQLNFIITFAGLFVILSDLGLSKLLIREFSRELKTNTSFFSNSLYIKLFSGILTFLIMLISINFIDKEFLILKSILLYTFVVIFSSLNEFLFSIYKAREIMDIYAKYNFFKTLLSFFIIISIIFFSGSIFHIIIGYLVSELIFTSVNLLNIHKTLYKIKINYDKKMIKYILRESWPLALGSIFITVYIKIDTIMLSFIKDDYQVGIYSATYKLLFAFQGFIGIIHISIIPKMSKFYHEKEFEKYKDLISKIIKNSFLFLFPLTILLSYLSEFILTTIFGETFSEGKIALIILFWNGFIIYFSVFFGDSLQMTGRQKKWTLAVGIGAVVNIILNFLLIPTYGYIGAAIATLVTEIIVFIIVFNFNDSRIKVKWQEVLPFTNGEK